MSRTSLAQPTSTLLLALLLFVGLSAAVAPFYPGATPFILIFIAVGSAMLATAAVAPPSFFTLTVALFLFVGFVGKALFHFTFGVPLIEPVGQFTEQWDKALGFATSGLAGVIAAILAAKLFPSFERIRQARASALVSNIVAAALIGVMGAGLVLYWANYEFHILRIGFPLGIDIHPRLYALLSFTITWGAVFGGLTLVLWAIELRGWGYQHLLYVAAALGFLAAVTMASRIQFLLYVLAAVWVIVWRWDQVRSWPQVALAFCVAVALFIASLLIVSLERTYDFVLSPQERAAAISASEAAPTVAAAAEPAPVPDAAALSEPAPPPGATGEPAPTAAAESRPSAASSEATPPSLPRASEAAAAAAEPAPVPDAAAPAQPPSSATTERGPSAAAAPSEVSPSASQDTGTPATSREPAQSAADGNAAQPPQAGAGAQLAAEQASQDDVNLLTKVEAISSHRVAHLIHELRSLLVMRWVGLEGVMTTAAEPERLGASLLWAGLKEDPAAGVDAIYQKMSGDRYGNVDYFTFLTLPGPVGVASYSGSLAAIFVLLFGLVLAGHALEWMTASLTGNLAAASVAGVSLAYLVVQMGFPWTLLIYAIELALVAIAVGLTWSMVNRFAPSGSGLHFVNRSGSQI